MKKKTKTNPPEYLTCVPDGHIPTMCDSWAEEWISIYNNGGIGYKGQRMPTEAEKMDIRKRIAHVQMLLQIRIDKLEEAWLLMK